MLPHSDSDIQPRGRPVINWTLIGICAIVLIYELTLGSLDREIFFYKFGLRPVEIMGGRTINILFSGTSYYNINSPLSAWLTIFTSMFIHADLLHFAGNMLFLWIFGNYVEVRFGHVRYLLFYLAAGVAGAWLQIATNADSQVPVIGASGAIAGVLALYLFFLPRDRLGGAIFFVGFWFFLQFAGAVGSLGPSAQGASVAYWAHVGGFVLGIAVGFIYKYITRPKPGGGNTEVPQYWRGRQL
jgi:membrane associated rhomboid family serine protease